MTNRIKVPRVAVAVVVTCKKHVLFGKRRIAENDYEWQLPGGWINLGESPAQAAEREVKEETGLAIAGLKFVAVTNNVFSPENHSISLCFEAECVNSDKLTTKEPDKCLGWLWLKWHDVEEKMFLPLANLKKSDYQPFIGDNLVESFSF